MVAVCAMENGLAPTEPKPWQRVDTLNGQFVLMHNNSVIAGNCQK
jgi:hypothetical protein